MSDFKQSAIDAILEDLAFDSVKELRAYVSKNKQDDYFYGGILHAINAVQDLPSAQPVARDTNVLSNDTISRQDAIRIVDGIDTWQAGWRGDAIESLKALPSAQPEIIRCKDCKYYEIAQIKKDGTDDKRYKPSICVKWKYGKSRKPDCFCADAERRTDG